MARKVAIAVARAGRESPGCSCSSPDTANPTRGRIGLYCTGNGAWIPSTLVFVTQKRNLGHSYTKPGMTREHPVLKGLENGSKLVSKIRISYVISWQREGRREGALTSKSTPPKRTRMGGMSSEMELYPAHSDHPLDHPTPTFRSGVGIVEKRLMEALFDIAETAQERRHHDRH